ncbi:MAG: putative glycolipid-binding domain-containing protein, partial [Acidimicrobiia bacterium]|nr:putative glycolipid-binding domain-containing protein [Acidimicrobiia bacterium]
RLEQTYQRAADGESGPAYDYEASRFEFSARLEYDWSGLVLRYPGIARRVT